MGKLGDEPASAGADRESDERLPAIGEPVLDQVTGLGARLVVTATRVVVIRDGSSRRPRTGIRAWPLDAIHVRLERPRHGAGRVVLFLGERARSTVSVFVAVELWPTAERVVHAIQRRATEARPPLLRRGRSLPSPRQPRN
jgi:hypothetical protein